MFVEVPISEGFDVDKVALCVKYVDKPVYFLLTRRGDSMEIHISAKGREGKRAIRTAGSKVIEWIPENFEWCKMIIATVGIKSVYNLCKKIGFIDLGKAKFKRGIGNIMVVKL